MDDFINLALIFWFLCEIIYFQLLLIIIFIFINYILTIVY